MPEVPASLLLVLAVVIGIGLGFVAIDQWIVQKLRTIRGTLVDSADVVAVRGTASAWFVKRSEELVAFAVRWTIAATGTATLLALVARWQALDSSLNGGQPWLVWVGACMTGGALGALAATAGARSEKAKILAVLETVAAARSRLTSGASDSEIQTTTRIALAKELRDAALFDANLTVDSTLTYLELENIGIFNDLSWRLEPRVNVLLGRNGYGKSYLLRLLAAAVANDAATLRRFSEHSSQGGARLLLHLVRDGQMVTSTHEGDLLEGEFGQFPLLAIPDTRFIDRSRNTVTAEDDELVDLARTGARRFLEDKPFDSAIQTVLAQMCIEALGLGQGGVKRPSTPQLDLVAAVVRELSEEEFRFHRIEQAGSGRFRILVETSASPERPIGINQASQGTLSVVAIFGLIYQFLSATHPASAPEDLCNCKGIVLIDEIDAHLHPAWQRQIVPLLRDRFPAVQFVVTAHSPLVVAGCGRGEVSVLVREDGHLRVVDHQRDFIGASIDEIHREIFEIEERDVTYLALNAKVPRLPELRREVEELQAQTGVDQAVIEGKLETIGAIERLRRDDARELGEDQLRREHEQYRLENIELRRQLEQSTAARPPDQGHVLYGLQGAGAMDFFANDIFRPEVPQASPGAATSPAHGESDDE